MIRHNSRFFGGFIIFLVAGILCLLVALHGEKNVLAGFVAGMFFLGTAAAILRVKVRQYTIELNNKTLSWKYSTFRALQ